MRCLAQGLVRPVRDGNGSYRLQRSNLDLRGDVGNRLGTNGTVSRVARGAAEIGGRRAAVAITGAVVGGGNRDSNGQHVKDKGDNHDHNDFEEVIHSNNDQQDFPVITDRLEQAVNRR